MRKILFIVTEYDSANGICVEAVMKECVKQGMQVFCVRNGIGKSCCRYQKDGISFEEVRPRLCYRLRIIKEKTSGPIKKKLYELLFFLINKVSLIFAYPTWPMVSCFFFLRIFVRLKKLYKETCFDYVVPVYSQIDSLIAAAMLKKKFPTVQVFPYMLDSLSGGYGPRIFSKKWLERRGLMWERLLFSRADKVVMMESARKHYQKHANEVFYRKTVFLDLPLFDPSALEKSLCVVPKFSGCISLVYLGTLPPKIRNPIFMVDVLSRLEPYDVSMKFIGCAKYDNELVALSKDKPIELLGPVSHDKSIEFMKDADILVNLGNTLEYMTPCKIFEYMSLGKPVVSTCPIRNEPSIKYLEKYPLALILYEDDGPDFCAIQLKHFIDSIMGQKINSEEINEQFKRNTPSAFVQLIN